MGFVAREEDSNSHFASGCENLNDFIRDLLPILDLLHDPDLHVVNDQSQSRWITNVFQRLWDI
jgi:hypothetical protein